MRETIQDIGMSKLTFRPERIDGGDVKALAENIETYGLQFPLLVTVNGKGEFEIIDGRRRYEALKLTEAEVAPCIVLSKEEAKKDLALILNTYRLNLSPVELYLSAVKYVKGELKGDPLALPPERIRDVAKKLNLDISATCRILNIGRLDKEAYDLLASRKLSLRLALLSIRISNKKDRQEFCKMCVDERPSIGKAREWIKWEMRKAPYEDIDQAVFDTEECKTCRHRGYRDKSLFDDSVVYEDEDGEDNSYCWNKSCYQAKTKKVWKEALKEAKEKLGLTGITESTGGWFDHIAFSDVVAIDPKKCKKCKRVKLTSNLRSGVFVVCPTGCKNIGKTKRSGATTTEKIPKKKLKDFTKEEKIAILEDRFALAARKVMIKYFIAEGNEFIEGQKPKSYKRILFFVGYDARMNPFRFGPIGYDPDYDYEKSEKEAKRIVAELDLKKVAELNLDEAAHHLSSYDRSGITPENIDYAIALLFGVEKWCASHYDEIKVKLSKRSEQFLKDVKPWKPSWTQGGKKK